MANRNRNRNKNTKGQLIKHEFKTSGARQVFVRIISGEQFDKDSRDARGRILKQAQVNSKPTQAQVDTYGRSVPNHKIRWDRNRSMMCLRQPSKTLAFKCTHMPYSREG